MGCGPENPYRPPWAPPPRELPPRSRRDLGASLRHRSQDRPAHVRAEHLPAAVSDPRPGSSRRSARFDPRSHPGGGGADQRPRRRDCEPGHRVRRARRGERLDDIVAALTAQEVAEHLYTGDLPDPDLIIRTSGEVRLSGFLLWQSAYPRPSSRGLPLNLPTLSSWVARAF